MPGSSTKTSNPYKDQLWLVCHNPVQMSGPYGLSAPWLHVKTACNVWTDTPDSPSNCEIHASSQRQMASGLPCPLLAVLAPPNTCRLAKGPCHTPRLCLPCSWGQVHWEQPTAVKRVSQQLHTQGIACCPVPGPSNAAEVANTSTGKETAEQSSELPVLEQPSWTH